MWQGKYQRWDPVPRLAGKVLYCEAVHDDWEGFRVWLRPEEPSLPMLIVKFASRLLYANSDEGDRLAGIRNMEEVKFPHAFWIVAESALVDEFHRQSVGIRANDKIVHYAFLSANDCIDVLSLEHPSFSYDEKAQQSAPGDASRATRA